MKKLNLNYLIKELKRFKNILISGPQRSGTTFFSKCIAEDLDYTLILE